MDRQTQPPLREQALEWVVLVTLYLLQVFTAEMLRAAINHGHEGPGLNRMVSQILMLLADHLHPAAMQIFGLWLGVMALFLIGRRRLPRWAFDGPGLWFTIRLMLEFFTINALIFRPSIVTPQVLLAQIVIYLPYFIIAWGWIFQRLDWVPGRPGSVLLLSDVHPDQPISRFDYFHSAINMLLNKGKQTISGVNRTGRLAVLTYMGMLLALYAVALARILQLSRSVI
ncbi:MAG: hypothetical protein WCF98_01835 [Synechococcus sp. ELA057]